VPGEVGLNDAVLDLRRYSDESVEPGQRTDMSQQLASDLHVRCRLTGGISNWFLRRRVGVSVRATVKELPGGSAVLPAEIEVLELWLLVALLKSRKHEESVLGYRWPKKISEERRYLAGGGPDLGLGMCDCVCLVHCGSGLAACLPTIVMIAEAGRIEGTRQSVDVEIGGECTYPNFCFWWQYLEGRVKSRNEK